MTNEGTLHTCNKILYITGYFNVYHLAYNFGQVISVHSAPRIGLRGRTTCRSRQRVVRVRLPGNSPVELADVLVLDGRRRRQIDGYYKYSVKQDVKREKRGRAYRSKWDNCPRTKSEHCRETSFGERQRNQ